MILELKEKIINDIYEILKKDGISKKDIILEKPKDIKLGDFSLPCFNYSKILKKAPNTIAEYLKQNINKDEYEKVEVVGGYLNIFLNKKDIVVRLLNKIVEEKEQYGNLDIGNNKTIVIDYSSPNIAKPFTVGHLRSTIIGNALKRILKKIGYKVIGINYLGDWGTQFGKLIYAYKTWVNEEAMKENPIKELKRLYVKFHNEAEQNEELNDIARKYFKRLENKEEEYIKLWEYFIDISLKEFNKMYNLLGITDFESTTGESFYNDKMDSVIKELKEKNLLEKDDGAMIVRLGDNLLPALIQKSDGASLYITRDLATLFHRKNKYKFDEALYVVGNEQTLHFNQLKQVLQKMGYDWYKDIHHISFGMVLDNGKRMATRKGKGVELIDVLNDSMNLSQKYIEEKNPNLENKKEISRIVGVGAVIFNYLKTYCKNDIDFNLENILKFEGETAPYICYTYARIKSVLTGISVNKINNINVDINDYIWNITLEMLKFEEVIIQAKEKYDPSELAKYLIDLAQKFNKFYGAERIITDNKEETEIKSLISESVSIILKEGMNLLGIKIPEKM
ncbi:MAG: arginine--tRNA ligase [Bacilli bacterium]